MAKFSKIPLSFNWCQSCHALSCLPCSLVQNVPLSMDKPLCLAQILGSKDLSQADLSWAQTVCTLHLTKRCWVLLCWCLPVLLGTNSHVPSVHSAVYNLLPVHFSPLGPARSMFLFKMKDDPRSCHTMSLHYLSFDHTTPLLCLTQHK